MRTARSGAGRRRHLGVRPQGAGAPDNLRRRQPRVGDNIDNITVSPRGGILLCENGDGITDEYRFGSRLLGITADGDSFTFAKNNIDLTLEDTVAAGKRIEPDYYRAAEWAGACFDPGGEVLFVNIQVPGITLAIWGPWDRGNL